MCILIFKLWKTVRRPLPALILFQWLFAFIRSVFWPFHNPAVASSCIGVRGLDHHGTQLTPFCFSHVQFDALSRVCLHVLLNILVHPRILKVLLIVHVDRPFRPCIRSLQVRAMLSNLYSHNLTSTPRILFSFIRSLNTFFPWYCQFSQDNLLGCRRPYHDIWSSGVYKMSSENCNRFFGSTRICQSLAVVSIDFNSNTTDFIKKILS